MAYEEIITPETEEFVKEHKEYIKKIIEDCWNRDLEVMMFVNNMYGSEKIVAGRMSSEKLSQHIVVMLFQWRELFIKVLRKMTIAMNG